MAPLHGGVFVGRARVKHGEVVDDLQITAPKMHGKGETFLRENFVHKDQALALALIEGHPFLGSPFHVVAVVAASHQTMDETEHGYPV